MANSNQDNADKMRSLKLKLDESCRKDMQGREIASSVKEQPPSDAVAAGAPPVGADVKMTDADITTEIIQKAVSDEKQEALREGAAFEALRQRVVGTAAGPSRAPSRERRRRAKASSSSSSSSRSSSSSTKSRKRGRSSRRRRHRRVPSPSARPSRCTSPRSPPRAHSNSVDLETYTIKFVQVCDDAHWCTTELHSAFGLELAETSPTTLTLRTSTPQEQVLDMVQDCIAQKFRLYFDYTKKEVSVRLPRQTDSKPRWTRAEKKRRKAMLQQTPSGPSRP